MKYQGIDPELKPMVHVSLFILDFPINDERRPILEKNYEIGFTRNIKSMHFNQKISLNNETFG